ncbi:hypothetical protein ABID16_003405 [Rhizobium aquaticum]|uniref:Uncharacterized protein n=1 Tax=Rhizobium aquaticum TaxID=1549636 RepID=A0ABV2J2S0_9HYPH
MTLRPKHLLLPLLALVFLATYQFCLVGLYANEGMLPLEMNLTFVVVFAVSICAMSFIFPSSIEKPSDVFLLFYVIICVLWNSVIWSATRLVTLQTVLPYFALLMLPPVCVILLRTILTQRMALVLKPVMVAQQDQLPLVFAALLVVGAVTAVMVVGGGSFDWDSMYARRLEGRDLYANHVLAGYALNMATNSALPMCGFFVGYRRSLKLALLCIAFVGLMFFLLGLKAPAVNFVGLGVLGLFLSIPFCRRNLVSLLLLGIFVVYALSLLLVIIRNNTFLADYLVRRISMVQPQLQEFYFDYFTKIPSIRGALPHALSDTTFEIGYLYLGNELSNANTNAFFYELSRGGIPAYMAASIVISLIYVAMDIFWKETRSPGFLGAAALFAVLLSEQSWTAVLLTSGMAVTLALVTLFSYPSRHAQTLEEAPDA